MICKVEHIAWESEAVQWTGDNLDEIIKFTKGEPHFESNVLYVTDKIAYNKKYNSLALINPFGGQPLYLSKGDWIIRTREGNLGPCTSESFKTDFRIISGGKAK